jgi:hypothetical protein
MMPYDARLSTTDLTDDTRARGSWCVNASTPARHSALEESEARAREESEDGMLKS